MKTRNTTSQSRGTALESLESRQLMSASLYAGTLTVSGSAYGDSIQVSRTTGPLYNTINVIENGVTTTFNASSVSSIRVYGNGGNDSLAIGAGVGGAYLNGGDGNDYLYGGSGADSLDGWNGDDYVSGGGGNDTLWGYFGNDRLIGGDGNDSCYGEGGSDTITGGSGADYLSGGDDNDYFYAFDGTGDTINGGNGWDQAQVDSRSWWEPWAANDSLSGVEIYQEP